MEHVDDELDILCFTPNIPPGLMQECFVVVGLQIETPCPQQVTHCVGSNVMVSIFTGFSS